MFTILSDCVVAAQQKLNTGLAVLVLWTRAAESVDGSGHRGSAAVLLTDMLTFHPVLLMLC